MLLYTHKLITPESCYPKTLAVFIMLPLFHLLSGQCSARSKSSLTRGVAVEGKAVGGAAGETGEDTSGGERDDAVAKLLGAGVALEGGEVGGETSNVGRGHGSTRDGVLLERLVVDESYRTHR